MCAIIKAKEQKQTICEAFVGLLKKQNA